MKEKEGSPTIGTVENYERPSFTFNHQTLRSSAQVVQLLRRDGLQLSSSELVVYSSELVSSAEYHQVKNILEFDYGCEIANVISTNIKKKLKFRKIKRD